MKRLSSTVIGTILALSFFLINPFLSHLYPQGDMLEYEVISVNPSSWVVTAREVASGNVVKFRLPPTVFKGKTFDGNLETAKRGQQLAIRGPRNARLNNLIMEHPIQKKGQSSHSKNNNLIKRRRIPPVSPALTWEIVNVDPRNWVVTVRNRKNGKTAKLKANPNAFKGFRFQADLQSIKKGRGFSIVAPNSRALNNVCTLMELKK